VTSRVDRLRKVSPGADEADIAALASLGQAEVAVITRVANQARRDALAEAAERKRQRKADNRQHRNYDEADFIRRNEAVVTKQGERAAEGNLDALAAGWAPGWRPLPRTRWRWRWRGWLAWWPGRTERTRTRLAQPGRPGPLSSASSCLLLIARTPVLAGALALRYHGAADAGRYHLRAGAVLGGAPAAPRMRWRASDLRIDGMLSR
jgi:hypothetical protein